MSSWTIHHFVAKYAMQGAFQGWLLIDEISMVVLALLAALGQLRLDRTAESDPRFEGSEVRFEIGPLGGAGHGTRDTRDTEHGWDTGHRTGWDMGYMRGYIDEYEPYFPPEYETNMQKV